MSDRITLTIEIKEVTLWGDTQWVSHIQDWEDKGRTAAYLTDETIEGVSVKTLDELKKMFS